MEKELLDKRAYIFDVDGTLYSQRKMRIIMGFQLLKHCVLNIKNFKELMIILRFRCLREEKQYKYASIDDLAEMIAGEKGLSAERVWSVIKTWMFDKPLAYMQRCAYQDVLAFIKNEIKRGAVVAIYSDYPAKDKLRALNVEPRHIFSAGESPISELKPSKAVMQHILEKIAVPKGQILYVGDRETKDGASAKLVEIDYMDIRIFRNKLKDKTDMGGKQ